MPFRPIPSIQTNAIQPWPAARWSSGQRTWGRRHKTGRRGVRYGRQRQRTQAGQRRAGAARHGRRGSKPGEGLVAGGGCPPSGAHTATAPGPPRTRREMRMLQRLLLRPQARHLQVQPRHETARLVEHIDLLF
ncbi:hypothetical protein PAHAL_9G398100 [Panicum hallii]|jgi:hypothetical protein|uniref:Uncharacterized protein n=1 Tax=Panicum hallii TaxID=206008 RepID=A0A2T8I440_9POAL|nr:hypothetical protein PAHAL_9G398100 [Panicum hallii]